MLSFTPVSFCRVSPRSHSLLQSLVSVAQSLSRVWLVATRGLQRVRLPCPPLSPWVCPNSYPLNQWCCPTISSSDVLFSFYLQSFPASGCFQMSELFISGGQSTGVLVSASVLPMNIQDWFPLGMTGWISLQSKGLWRVFSSTTIWKHLFFGTQPSLCSNSHIRTWLPEKP